MHTSIPILNLACTNKRTSWSAPLVTTSKSFPLHTQISSYLLEFAWWWQTHKHTHTYLHPRFMACTDTQTHTHTYTHASWLAQTHSSFTLTGAFPLHASSITINLCTYSTSVEASLLSRDGLLQSVLWDIRAWSARYLVDVMLVYYWCVTGVFFVSHLSVTGELYKNNCRQTVLWRIKIVL